MSRRSLALCASAVAVVGIWTFPLRGDDNGDAHVGRSPSRNTAVMPQTAAVRARQRDAALRNARTHLGAFDPGVLVGAPPSDVSEVLTRDDVECRYLPRATGGTSFKFECVLSTGAIVRVKYGHEPEIYAEAAATRLLASLGYATDHVYIVPRLRCHGCPANPFLSTLLLDAIGAPIAAAGGYTDFEWVAVERRFDAPAIEDDTRQGWAWWELENAGAPRDDLDALRLVAVFLAHWDNKAENQRLVCMDDGAYRGDGWCRDPVLMIQDLGSTFGPTKINRSRWRATPVWLDRSTCTLTMRTMPYGGGTFGDARITDAARMRIGRELASFSDGQLRAWFAAARFPQYYAATDDDKDMTAWLQAYRDRVSQILQAGPCPSRADGAPDHLARE